ncbi:hypothetical protein L5876_12110 [Hyphobacterium sp. SN044]|uniref:hypothetical protein n=1 Tax=Hyphobacterium sp. SN044 TaxID=2912575 RepID=UPI001F22DC45|nr:hypothetical protein [Hyphobacterium sp. SN044]MCF8880561.1 hypothetical protein [Hyphobacterium sp. SN044]
MFRPLIIALFAVSAAPAFAGPGADLGTEAAELRDEAQARADALAASPAAPAEAVDESFVVRVEEFSAAAAMLSRRIEDANGPQDLRCIFRGMSADAGARLDDFAEAETQADTARVYLEYVYLFNQAAEIAPEADAELPRIEPDPGFACPASRDPLGEG